MSEAQLLAVTVTNISWMGCWCYVSIGPGPISIINLYCVGGDAKHCCIYLSSCVWASDSLATLHMALYCV